MLDSNRLPFDVIILGAGGAGMMCAIHAAKRGRKVAIIDHSAKTGGKIIISGGGRCNFTNLLATSKNFYSQNDNFCKSALSRFTPQDFLSMIQENQISYHERKHGQLFCDGSAQSIINMLEQECRQNGVQFFMKHKILKVEKPGKNFEVNTQNITPEALHEAFEAESLVVATGGLSIPKIGATGFGYDLARQFGLKIIPTTPALDGFVFKDEEHAFFDDFAGITQESTLTCSPLGRKTISFTENLLFTHHGLSGPVALQASLHWSLGETVLINFIPTKTRAQLIEWLNSQRPNRSKIENILSELIPKRLAERYILFYWPKGKILPNLTRAEVEAFCEKLQNFKFVPASTVGYSKAEVTRGGVDTDELSSRTLESKKESGLFFIGEVVDVTGWLGGFNYQWAWASGAAAGAVA